MVTQANSTYAQIEIAVRRLTASPSEQSLPSTIIQGYVNRFYNADFPAAIKVDQMRSVYTFYTTPNKQTYPLDVNYNQGVRAPVFVDGIEGTFSKDRQQFFAMYPKFPTQSKPISGDGVTVLFNFTVGSIPFLPNTVILGGVNTAGTAITVADDGIGNLQLQVPNPIVSVPLQTTTPPVAGMYNRNTLNPGLYTVTNIGTVNYVTGAISITFPVAPATGTQMVLRVSQYQTGRPYSLLFWNNEFTVRPVPKEIHKIEVETYLSPVQFMNTTDNPILNQWADYIALGSSIKILRDRQDMDGVANLMPFFKEQAGLVLERQGVEEIGQRNSTVFSGQRSLNQGYNNGGFY